jgi:hypothetical protein
MVCFYVIDLIYYYFFSTNNCTRVGDLIIKVYKQRLSSHINKCVNLSGLAKN